MKKEEILVETKKHLLESEDYVGTFQAMGFPHIGWSFLIGPFSAFLMKHYIVTLTDSRILFHQLNLSGNFQETSALQYSDIKTLKVRRGILTHKMKFVFINEKKMIIKAQAKGVEKVLKIKDEWIDLILSKIKIA